MSNNPKENINSLGLFELLAPLLIYKKLIGFFSVIGLILGVLFSSQIEDKYISNLDLTVNLVPPFYDKYITFHERGPRLVLIDFIALLHSRTNFMAFEKSKTLSRLSVEEITDTMLVNGNEFSKSSGQRFFTFSPAFTSAVRFSMFTNDEKKLTEFYSYALFTSKVLKRNYIAKHKEFLELISKPTEAMPLDQAELARIFPAMLSFSENTSPLIIIKKPTFPSKLPSRRNNVIFFSFLLGLISGIVMAFYNFEKEAKIRKPATNEN